MSKKSSLLTAVALCVSAVVATPSAQAAYCGVTAVPEAPAYTCFLTPNAANHFVHISISPFLTANLVDVWTFVIVYHGAAGIWGIEKTVTGLTNKYYGAVVPRPVAGTIVISND